jgi:four helix bundle protein
MDYDQEFIDSLLIKDISEKYETDLKQRIFDFAVNTLMFLMKLPHHRELDVIRYQLSKSSTSIGANFEEAQSTTMKEFVQKLRIALREANESKYWFKIVKELNLGDSKKLNLLLNEVHEISLMLGTIVSKVDKKLK